MRKTMKKFSKKSIIKKSDFQLFWYLTKTRKLPGFKRIKQVLVARVTRIKNENSKNIDSSLSELNKYFFVNKYQTTEVPRKESIDIIVPIFNGYQYITKLLPSVLKNTAHPYRLLIVDDASTDPLVREYLEKVAATYEHVRLFRLEKNKGFVGAVNYAMSRSSSNVVLLNQDTEVPPDWLDRLIKPISDDPTVASVTPFTNSGTICSFPKFLEDNRMFGGLGVEDIDLVFRTLSFGGNSVDLPTAVGFCMAINRNTINKIGFFDEDSFSRGYGEENDWCMRARKLGARHVMVTNLFVYHKHGGAFPAEEKVSLQKKNWATLIAMHPDYPRLVSEFIEDDPLQWLRQLQIIRLALYKTDQKATLIIDHELGGGANRFSSELRQNCIKSGHVVFFLIYSREKDIFKITFFYNDYCIDFYTMELSEVSRFFKNIHLRNVTLQINNLVSYPDLKSVFQLIINMKEITESTIKFYVHDYLLICPAYTLINNTGAYCGVPGDLNICASCLKDNDGEHTLFYGKHQEIVSWRSMWREFLGEVDNIVCFSTSSKNILERGYPRLKANISIEPHDVRGLDKVEIIPKADYFTIGFIGAINYQKGLRVIEEMASIAREKELQVLFVVIGYTAYDINTDNVIVTGEYKRDDLPKLLAKHNIDIVFLPAIGPETFSYTAQEVMLFGLPLAVFNIGAPPERVSNYSRGLVIDSVDSWLALKRIIENFDLDNRSGL